MADNSKIEWTNATWTPVKGCTRASEGCRNCYAEVMAARFNQPGQWGHGLAEIVQTPQGKDHRWTGWIRFDEAELLKPLHWKRPRKVFVCSTADLFHEIVPDEWIDRVFAVMALCPQHTFQVLTKRSARMREYFRPMNEWGKRVGPLLNEIKPSSLWNGSVYQGWQEIHGKAFLPNVWLGVSVEDQASADERIPDLLATPAAVRWISAEPLLGPVDLSTIYLRRDGRRPTELSNKLGDYIRPLHGNFTNSPKLDWIVCGGESGPGARPMHPDWARALRDQCQAAGVPFLFKQWGEWAPLPDGADESYEAHRARGGRDMMVMKPDFIAMELVGKKCAGRLLDGVLHDEYPQVQP